MPKIAAIEFEENLVRVLVAKTSGSSFQLSSAFEVDLGANWEDKESEFGKNLAAALGNRIGRCEALVSFGRGNSELRVINVPIVPDNELPEIVKFQAIRQFTNAIEDSPVDFLPLTDTADEKRVLAATVPKETIDRLKNGCQTAGLNVKAIKLRATCTTALAQAVDKERKNYVIVEPTDRSFNLEVVAFGKLCLTRTVRAASSDSTDQIVRDIRRTLAAANNQIQGYEANSVVVFGDETEFAGLRAAIEEQLQFDVSFVNPFDHTTGLGDTPENPGHYASLVGLLTSYCSAATETIDFLNPRRKQTDRGNNRVALLAGIAAAILFIGLGALGYLMLSQKSSQIAKIRAEIQQNADSDKIAKELIGDVEKIEAFENNQAVWLRELALISEKAMSPDQVILNSATFTLDIGRGDGSVKMEANGYLQSGDISEKIGNRIRDSSKYNVTLENVVMLSEKEKDQELYTHKFKARINRDPELQTPEFSEDDLKQFMAPRKERSVQELAEKEKNGGDPPPQGNSSEEATEEKKEKEKAPDEGDPDPDDSQSKSSEDEGEQENDEEKKGELKDE